MNTGIVKTENENDLLRLCHFFYSATTRDAAQIPEILLLDNSPDSFTLEYCVDESQWKGSKLEINGADLSITLAEGVIAPREEFKELVTQTLNDFRMQWRKQQGLTEQIISLDELPIGTY